MTYVEIYRSVYGDEGIEPPMTPAERKAWRIIDYLEHHKRFRWWWDDADPETQNTIFAKIVTLIESE